MFGSSVSLMVRFPASRQAKAASDSCLRPRVVFGCLCTIRDQLLYLLIQCKSYLGLFLFKNPMILTKFKPINLGSRDQYSDHWGQWWILMKILGIPLVSYAIMLPTIPIVAFHLSIILVTYQIYWNGSSIRQDKKSL